MIAWFSSKQGAIRLQGSRESWIYIYASSTGQLINPSKCSIICGQACPDARRVDVKNTLNVVQETFETKYLGLSTPEGRMGKDKFESLQAKLDKCLVEWDDNHKSQVAKEV
jgi:hypothetical protein